MYYMVKVVRYLCLCVACLVLISGASADIASVSYVSEQLTGKVDTVQKSGNDVLSNRAMVTDNNGNVVAGAIKTDMLDSSGSIPPECTALDSSRRDCVYSMTIDGPRWQVVRTADDVIK